MNPGRRSGAIWLKESAGCTRPTWGSGGLHPPYVGKWRVAAAVWDPPDRCIRGMFDFTSVACVRNKPEIGSESEGGKIATGICGILFFIQHRPLWRFFARQQAFLPTGGRILYVEEPFWWRALDAGARCLVT